RDRKTAAGPSTRSLASTSVVKATWLAVLSIDGAKVVGRRFAGLAIRNNVEFDLLALIEPTHTSALDCADVHEDVLAAIVRLNEAETFLAVEPLHGSL